MLKYVLCFMSRTNETRHIKWHETCKCKCRLDGSVNHNKENVSKYDYVYQRKNY